MTAAAEAAVRQPAYGRQGGVRPLSRGGRGGPGLDRSSAPDQSRIARPRSASRDRRAAPVADDGGGDRRGSGMPLSTVSAVLTRIGLGKLRGSSRPSRPTATSADAGRARPHRRQEARCGSSGAGHRVTGDRHGSRKGRDRLGVRARLRRRRDPTRLRRSARRRESLTAVGFLRRAVAYYAAYGIHGRARPDRQRARLHLDSSTSSPAPRSASTTSAHGPTGPAPTEKQSASSAPCSAAGPTAPSTLAVRVGDDAVGPGGAADAYAGLDATIAEAACSWTRCVSRISTSARPASAAPLELAAGQRAGDAAGPLLHVGAGGVVHVLVGDHVGDGEAAARPQYAGGLAQHLRLSPERLITQLEMTTSTLASGSGSPRCSP